MHILHLVAFEGQLYIFFVGLLLWALLGMTNGRAIFDFFVGVRDIPLAPLKDSLKGVLFGRNKRAA